MKFTRAKSANGTGLRGEILITYYELLEIFGPPNYGPNADLDKTTCEWFLEFEDGTVATIYDWKTDRTPMGEYEWHVGGHKTIALDHVLDAVQFHRDNLVKFIRSGVN